MYHSTHITYFGIAWEREPWSLHN